MQYSVNGATRSQILMKDHHIYSGNKIPADMKFHPCAASSGFTLYSSFTPFASFVWHSHTFKMHTRTCSHFLVLTYASTNTRAHISAACGRHPQCCETSCIPHAYITPFPPPPADHSSFYTALARSLSPLSLLLKSVWLAPSSSERSFVPFYTRGIKGSAPPP